MKVKRNLYQLADIISAQTQLDHKIVLSFLNQFFKEIERGLIVSSVVKIDNLGIFRIIKSLSADRLLFLGKFASDSVSSRLNEDAPAETDVNVYAGLSETWLSDNAKYTNEPSEEIGAFDNETEDTDSDDAEKLSADEEKQADKKKWSRKFKIFALFFGTLIIVVGVIYSLYLYPKKSDTEKQEPFSLMFTELENSDTVSFSHVIQVASHNVDFYSLSKIYYLHEQFWPYIYSANENVVSGPFEIPQGTTIKIPKLDAELINYNNRRSVDKAKALVNNIMKSATQ